VWSAGAKTVWRIISNESSSIEDYKLFPVRTLTAVAPPFHFDDGVGNGHFDSLSAGRLPATITINNNQQPLETFLHDSDTVAFLVIKDDAILMERYFQGTMKQRLSLPSRCPNHSFLSSLVRRLTMALSPQLTNPS
jgi:hypothetical protein